MTDPAASRPRHKWGRLVVLVIVLAFVAGAGWLAWQAKRAKAELRAPSRTCNR